MNLVDEYLTRMDEYLAEVKGAMAGMERRVRDDILRELRSHLAESAAANGGDPARAIRSMGSPAQVGREYRRVYGYGRAFKAIFLVAAAACAVLSAPVLMVTADGPVPNPLSLPFLVLLVGWLLWVSAAAGSRVGLFAGLLAFATRVAVAGALALANPGATSPLLGGAFFALSSVLLVLLGWLPGTAKQAWTKPGADL